VIGFSDLRFIERTLLRDLKHSLVNAAVVTPEGGEEGAVGDVERVDQVDGERPDFGEENVEASLELVQVNFLEC
jgi:hypothetical protein